MIIKILIGLIVLIAGYFFLFHMKNHEPMTSSPDKAKFYPSEKFNGAREGYVFKMDTKGLGYYLDI